MSHKYMERAKRRMELFLDLGCEEEVCLKAAGVSCETVRAQCSRPEDEKMLVERILEEHGDFKVLDDAIAKFRLDTLMAVKRALAVRSFRRHLQASVHPRRRSDPRRREDTSNVGMALRGLRDGDREVRLSALKVLEMVSHDAKSCDQALREITDCLADPERDVRLAAIQALIVTSKQGNRDLRTEIEFCLERLKDPAGEVRSAALGAVRQIVPLAAGRREGVLAAACDILKDRDKKVREAALRAIRDIARTSVAMKELSPDGSAEVVEACQPCLQDEHKEVRLAALATLKDVSPGEAAVTASLQCLQDQHEEVRLEALATLMDLSPDDAAVTTVVEALERCLGDQHMTVRLVALAALKKVKPDANAALFAAVRRLESASSTERLAGIRDLATAAHGNDSVVLVALLTRSLEDQDAKVRLTAFQAWKDRVQEGDEVMIAVCLRRLDGNSSKEVCIAALGALSFVACSGDAKVIDACLCYLHGGDNVDWEVRDAVVESLVSLADGRAKVVSNVLLRLHQKDWRVRRTVLSALEAMAQKGNKHVLEEVLHLAVDDEITIVREEATHALTSLTDVQDLAGLKAKLQLIDSNSNLRSSAAQALAALVEKGYAAALEMALRRLEMADTCVTFFRVAVRALQRVAERGDRELISMAFERLREHYDEKNPCKDWRIRRAAVGILHAVGTEGDPKVLAALLHCLGRGANFPTTRGEREEERDHGDRDRDVRSAAAEALGALAVRGDEEVTAALLEVACDGEEDAVVRAAAARAFRVMV